MPFFIEIICYLRWLVSVGSYKACLVPGVSKSSLLDPQWYFEVCVSVSSCLMSLSSLQLLPDLTLLSFGQTLVDGPRLVQLDHTTSGNHSSMSVCPVNIYITMLGWAQGATFILCSLSIEKCLFRVVWHCSPVIFSSDHTLDYLDSLNGCCLNCVFLCTQGFLWELYSMKVRYTAVFLRGLFFCLYFVFYSSSGIQLQELSIMVVTYSILMLCIDHIITFECLNTKERLPFCKTTLPKEVFF